MGILKKGNDWFLDYRDGYGRRRRKKIGTSKKLAQAVWNKIKTEIVENKYLDVRRDEKIRFKDFGKTYMELHAKPNKRSWRTSDQNSLRRLTPFFGEMYLFEITPLLIEKYKMQRSEQKITSKLDQRIKPATINRELACLKGILNKAIEWGKLRENPAKKVKLFKENNQRTRCLEKEDIGRLLANCSPKLLSIVMVILNTGMRKGEAQNLKWSDLTFRDTDSFITLTKTKSGKPRIIPMNTLVKTILIATPKHPQSPYVFCNKEGKPYNFRKSFETALKKSGIMDFRFHDLRHTFASYLGMSGSDLNTIRELLGHATFDMTRRYTHALDSHKRNAVDVLGRIMDTFWTPTQKLTEKPKSDKVPSSFPNTI